MKIIKIDKNGKIQEKDLSRKNLTDLFKVHSRDLRPVFTRKQVMTIAPRGNCIVVSMRSVKMIIAKNHSFIFNLEKKKIGEYFIPFIQERIAKSKDEKIRFEHLILDATLLYIFEKVQRRFEDIERTSEQIMGKLKEKKLSDQTFEQLLHVKKRLSKLGTHVEEVENELTELVEDDEDLADLYLETEIENDTDEIESILENILEQIEDVTHKIEDLDENIDDTQEILTLKMNNLRNAIIKYDLIFTAATGVLAFIAIITGLYGMNLQNHLEHDPSAFWHVGAILFGIFILGSAILMLWMKRMKIL